MNPLNILALSCAVLLGVCSTRAISAQALWIENAWIRAMPPTQRMTAGYLDIRNSGDVAVEITGARTKIAAHAQIHVSREVDGYVSMQRLDQLTVNPGETLSLAPGGMHLMLMGMEKMPLPGTDTDICLILSSGKEICAIATVRKSASGVQSQHH
ncbi:MAG: copper(I)-binding protein [Halioglobus sp.]|jgi:copper(I)-binding protein